jgi:hypothetical protein
MIENYVNTIEAVQLYVYASGSRVSADSTPTATAIDIESNAVVELSGVLPIDSGDGYNYYEVSLEPSEVTHSRTVAITWEYVYETAAFTRVDIITLTRPYFDADEFWQQFPEFSDDGENPLTIDEVQRLERQVRFRINAYCNQSFQDFGQKSVKHRGNGTNALTLSYPVYRLESVTGAAGTVLFSRDLAGDVDVSTAGWEFEYGAHITKSSEYDSSADGFLGVHKTRNLFKDNHYYTVDAHFGWKFLPTEVSQAALILSNELAQPEDRYRQKNITKVSSSDYKLEFGGDHHSTTGNVDADTMLGRYIWGGVYVF